MQGPQLTSMKEVLKTFCMLKKYRITDHKGHVDTNNITTVFLCWAQHFTSLNICSKLSRRLLRIGNKSLISRIKTPVFSRSHLISFPSFLLSFTGPCISLCEESSCKRSRCSEQQCAVCKAIFFLLTHGGDDDGRAH